MADEITLSASLAFAKGSITGVLRAITSLTPDVAGTRYHQAIQNIGTSEEAIGLGDAGIGGWMLLINRDATNFIKIRAASGAADLIKLLPGEPCLFRSNAGITPYAIADNAACDLEVLIISL